MTSSLSRRAGAVTLIAALTATVLTGCGGVGAQLTFTDVEKAKVTDIVITGHSGDVMIKTAAIAETRINRVIRRNSDPGESYQLRGTTLAIDTGCGDNCRVSYDITAPVGVKVQGRLDSGDIMLTEVGAADVAVMSGQVAINRTTGPVTARATSGDVLLTEVTGKITAEVTSGQVDGMHLAGGPLDVRVTSGDVELMVATPMSVTAEAHSGDIRLRVPGGKYATRIEAQSGDAYTEGGIDEDSSSPHKLTVTARSGDVTVAGGFGGPPSAPDAPSAPAAPSPSN